MVLTLDPSSQSASLTDNVSVDLVILGLAIGGSDSLADFDTAYDPGALFFVNYSLGSF